MADNMALKLLIAGVVGAVIGAAVVSDRFHPEGVLHSGFARGPWLYRSWQHDPAADDGDGRPERADSWENWDDWEQQPPPAQHYRARSRPTRATCWREVENWDFGTVRRPVPCDHRRS